MPALKQALIPFVKGHACTYIENLEYAFHHFTGLLGDCPDGMLSPLHISYYAEKLLAHQRYRVGTLNALLQKWVELGLPGVEPECATYLLERRKPGNKKGEAVRTRNPVEGPLSEEEYAALYSAANAAYGRGELPLWTLLLARLLLACGGRISQFASLKICDFDESTYVLQLPQAKTRAENIRVSFVEFDISPQTGRLLTDYLNNLREDGYGHNSPFFPSSLIMVGSSRGCREARATDDLFFGHCSPELLSQRFRRFIRPIAPPTSRLDYAPTPLTPRRFRYTFGTRLAEEGASKVVIANRLGHVDLQHVEVYVAASPKIVENIDRTMGAALAPLARAFKGQLVEDEAHTTHKGVPGSRIIDFRVAAAPVGSCAGRGQGCAFNKPVACYTCFRFEPWLDAPHEKVLKRLRREREKCGGDDRMAAVNDEPIRAVEEVISLCARARRKRRAADTEVPS
nr:site-specific integrase [Burkholderia multivorans]